MHRNIWCRCWCQFASFSGFGIERRLYKKGIFSWKFRIVLFLGSVVVFLLIARFVRKQRIQVKDGIFWILFSVILIIFSIFPRLAIWASYLTGVQSPAYCVFMLIIFSLGCHQFFLSIKVSQLTIKNSELIQDIAIYRTLEGEEKRAIGEENSLKKDLLFFRRHYKKWWNGKGIGTACKWTGERIRIWNLFFKPGRTGRQAFLWNHEWYK